MVSSKTRIGAVSSRLPAWKKALFALATVSLFFCLFEVALALAGVRPIVRTEDPYVGFSGTTDLFRLENGVYSTALAKRDWFNDQRFNAQRTDDVFRIFALGGSTTYGRPYDDSASFSGWLREMLKEVGGDRSWEVINAGGISYASYRVALLMEELAAYQPDLFVIYTGHNEFLERRTYSQIFQLPKIVRRAGGWATRLRLFAAGWRLLEPDAGANRQANALPAEVDTILEHSVGPRDYVRDDEQRRQTVEHFRFNLNRMVDIARSAGAGVLFIAPESNLASCSPFKSQASDDLSADQAEAFQRCLRQAEGEPDHATALGRLSQAVAIDPRYAEAHYRRGRALLALGRFDEARQAFERAREEDICPLRAVGAIREAVVRTAEERNTLLVDLSSRLRARSEGGVLGQEIFLDHVHMTAEGYRIVAEAVLEALAEAGVAPAMLNAEALARAARRVRARIDRQAEGRALRNLAKVFDWAGRYEEAERLARQAATILGEDRDTLSVLGHAAARRGDLPQAERYFRQAAKRTTGRAEPFYDWGTTLLELGRQGEAIAALEKARTLSPDDVDTLFNLGLALHGARRIEEAEARFREALTLEPASVDAAVSLANLLVESGRPYEAAQQLEQASRRAGSDDRRIVFQTGVVLAALGRFAEAAERYQQAIRLDPRDAKAHNNLGMTYLLMEEPARAAGSLRRALELAPAAETHAHLANALMLAGRRREAAEQFEEAMRLRPEWPAPRIQWAWFLAAHPNPDFRDGDAAVRLAKQAVEFTDQKDPLALDALAAAYAETGRFDKARIAARRSLDLLSDKKSPQAAETRQRLALYQSGHPYRMRLIHQIGARFSDQVGRPPQ